MARTLTKKPVTRRAPAASKVAAPEVKAGVAAKSGGAPKPVEWPVGATKAAKKSDKVVVPPKADPVPKAPVTKAIAPALAEAVAKPVAATPTIVPEASPEAQIITETPPIPAPAIAPAIAEAATKGKFIMTDALETAKTYAEEAKTRIQSAVAEMNEKAKVAMEKSSKAFEEMGELTKGNLEAVVESSKIAAKGVESISQGAADFGRKHFEKTSATMKSFAAVKSPAEFFQLQSELMSSFMDSVASESAKSSETMLKLVSDISAPISNRVSIVTEKFKSLAA